MVAWYDEWRQYGVLPYGSQSLSDEPALVFDAIRLCDSVASEAFREQARLADV
jgi:hypothetical protein